MVEWYKNPYVWLGATAGVAIAIPAGIALAPPVIAGLGVIGGAVALTALGAGVIGITSAIGKHIGDSFGDDDLNTKISEILNSDTETQSKIQEIQYAVAIDKSKDTRDFFINLYTGALQDQSGVDDEQKIRGIKMINKLHNLKNHFGFQEALSETHLSCSSGSNDLEAEKNFYEQFGNKIAKDSSLDCFDQSGRVKKLLSPCYPFDSFCKRINMGLQLESSANALKERLGSIFSSFFGSSNDFPPTRDDAGGAVAGGVHDDGGGRPAGGSRNRPAESPVPAPVPTAAAAAAAAAAARTDGPAAAARPGSAAGGAAAAAAAAPAPAAPPATDPALTTGRASSAAGGVAAGVAAGGAAAGDNLLMC